MGWLYRLTIYNSGKSNYVRVMEISIPFQAVKAPRYQANCCMKVVLLLAPSTGLLYPLGKSWYQFLIEAEMTETS
jgi:hypothetical protein